VPFSVGVPVNLRSPRSWLDGVCNATIPWAVRLETEDPVECLDAVARQLRPVRSGRYSPEVRALLAYATAHDGLPVRLRHSLATSTVVTSLPGADQVPSTPGLRVSGLVGGAPAPASMGMTFAVVGAPTGLRLTARFLFSHHTGAGASRFLASVDDAIAAIGTAVEAQKVPA
jgi:hypothetical protein